MDRRKFTKVMGAVVAGLAAGSKALAADDKKADDKAAKNICKGHNECKGKGACHTDKNGCAGQNECKGKGWISVPRAECSSRGGKVLEG